MFLLFNVGLCFRLLDVLFCLENFIVMGISCFWRKLMWCNSIGYGCWRFTFCVFKRRIPEKMLTCGLNSVVCMHDDKKKKIRTSNVAGKVGRDCGRGPYFYLSLYSLQASEDSGPGVQKVRRGGAFKASELGDDPLSDPKPFEKFI